MHSIFIENECTLREQLYYLNVKTRMHWHDIGKYELQKKKTRSFLHIIYFNPFGITLFLPIARF